MTREEIEELKGLAASMGLYDDKNPCKRAVILGKAIQELEQEPVINKIRAEIEQEIIPRNSDQYDHEAMWQNMGLRMALKVIDKYKAKTEVDNGNDD